MSTTTATSTATTTTPPPATTTVSATTTYQTGVQYGFYFNQDRCIDCRACVVACMNWYNIPAGSVYWARMFQWETGTFPNVRLNYLFAPCYHCGNPACVAAAPGTIYKEPKYGAVLIDPAQATSPSLRDAWEACPYGAISFSSDDPNATASKCTMCVDRLEAGLKPSCVEACQMRALDFDTMPNLYKNYGTVSQLDGMPSPSTTEPSVVFKAHGAKTALVPYDANTAVALLGSFPSFSPLPPLYTDTTIPTTTTPGLVGRSALNMKPGSVAEVQQVLQHDEG